MTNLLKQMKQHAVPGRADQPPAKKVSQATLVTNNKQDTSASRPRGARDTKPPPKTAKGKRRREQLIAAVSTVLNDRGYSSMSVNDIVAEANAPVGLFYRYFRNKTEIVVAALDTLIEEFRSALPPIDGEGPFFEWLCTSHRALYDLFTEKPGLLGCYYSFDCGEPAFAQLFHKHTLQFDHDSINHALAALGRKHDTISNLIPLAHALTSMIDNFAFRYSTGRDETSRIEKAAKLNLPQLTAVLRYRGLMLKHAPEGDTLPVFSAKARHKIAQVRIELPAPKLKVPSQPRRSPKRSDSAHTYAALKDAALQVLNRLPYDSMRISDIEDEGKTTRGSIYHYFGEKRDLVIELIDDRLEAIQSALQPLREGHTTGKNIHPNLFHELSTVIGIFVCEYHQNPGVLRTIYQIEDQDRDFAEFLRAHRRCWILTITGMLSRFLQSPKSSHHQLDIIAHGILAMTERFCYDLYVTPVAEIAPKLSSSSAATDLLAATWFRILLLKSPPNVALNIYPALTTTDTPPPFVHETSRQKGRRKWKPHAS